MRRKGDQNKSLVDSATPSRRPSRRSRKSLHHQNAKRNIEANALPKSETEMANSSAQNDEVDSNSSTSCSRISDSETVNAVANVLQRVHPKTSPIINDMDSDEKYKVIEIKNELNLVLDSCSKFIAEKSETSQNRTGIDSATKIFNEVTSADKNLLFKYRDELICTETRDCVQNRQEVLLKAAAINAHSFGNINVKENKFRVDGIPCENSSVSTDDNAQSNKKLATASILLNSEEILPIEKNKKTKKSIKTTRKRKWLSKRPIEFKEDILLISSDSLKKIISDVLPVPLSDVKLESSSEVEEVFSDKSEVRINSPKYKVKRSSREKSFRSDFHTHNNAEKDKPQFEKTCQKLSYIHKTPSPPKNESSTILFITNLVRPFTLLQLKGLLARTGKIVADGFWIDRIKSKCYVQYETEDEAVETRHALHGVHWPPSNPKCLNVDFGNKACMEKALEISGKEVAKFGKGSSKENRIVGSGWDRECENYEEKKTTRTVREWDVGKKEDNHKGRETIRDARDGNLTKNLEEQERKRHLTETERLRTSSISPYSGKLKRLENDPPLRLLDDLFRKTRVAPCIYWLPLTPEQIAEKEAFRLKRIAEHQERLKKRELEREKNKTREKEREKEKERKKDREKESWKENARRRYRSSDRLESASRENRRY